MGDLRLRRPCIITADITNTAPSDVDFYDTSFFEEGRKALPTPEAILADSMDSSTGIVKLQDLNLVVKFGPSDAVSLEEARAMRAVRQAFSKEEVPVPEVFGFKRHHSQNFIYMSLVRGQTLREAWSSLDTADKNTICTQLRQIVASLRSACHDRSEVTMIGSVCGGTLQDRFFKLDHEKGPLSDIRSFNDCFLAVATRQTPGPSGEINTDEIYRQFLPDEGQVVLTHGDLTLGNIIISDLPGPRRIVGIIDWEQAGWYPDYWEYYKLCYGVAYTHEWREAGWSDTVITPIDDDLFDAISAYFSWRNP